LHISWRVFHILKHAARALEGIFDAGFGQFRLQLKIKDPFVTRRHTQQPFVSRNSHTYIGNGARPLDLIPLRLSGLQIGQNKSRPIGTDLQGDCFPGFITQYRRLSIDSRLEEEMKRRYRGDQTVRLQRSHLSHLVAATSSPRALQRQ